MVAEEQVRLVHVNLVRSFGVLPQHQPSGFVRVSRGVMVAATGSPLAFFNEVLPVDDDVDADAIVEAAALADEAGLAWTLHLRDGIDDDLVPTVHASGLEEVEGYPAMVLTALPERLPDVPGLRVKRIQDVTGFERYVDTAGSNIGANARLVETFLGAGIIEEPDVALLLGLLDGQPVATSISIRSGDVVGVYNVATAEPARRRGVGWAMTAAAILAGADAGATTATLQSSPMAQPMYSSHGFRTVFHYRLFRRPPQPQPPASKALARDEATGDTPDE
jgi:ribosomal protein S18 acetylase RimI-like enzyme